MSTLDEWQDFYDSHRAEISEGIHKGLKVAKYLEDCFAKGVVPNVNTTKQLISHIKVKAVTDSPWDYNLPRDVRKYTDDPLSYDRTNFYFAAHTDWKNGHFMDAFEKFKELNELSIIDAPLNKLGFSKRNAFRGEMIEVLENIIAPDVYIEDGKFIVEKKPADLIARVKQLIDGIKKQVVYQTPVKSEYVKPVYLDELKSVLSVETQSLEPLAMKESWMSWEEFFNNKKIAIAEELVGNNLVAKLKQDINSYQQKKKELLSNIESLKKDARIDFSLIDCDNDSVSDLDRKLRKMELVIKEMSYLECEVPKLEVKLNGFLEGIRKQAGELSSTSFKLYTSEGIAELIQELSPIYDIERLVKMPENRAVFEAVYNHAGYRYKELTEFSKAIDCYKKALDLNPKSSNNWCSTGHLHEDLGNLFYNKGSIKEASVFYSSALKFYENSVNLEPKWNGDTWYRMAKLYSAFSDYKNAIRCYEQVVMYYEKEFINEYKIAEKIEDAKKLILAKEKIDERAEASNKSCK